MESFESWAMMSSWIIVSCLGIVGAMLLFLDRKFKPGTEKILSVICGSLFIIVGTCLLSWPVIIIIHRLGEQTGDAGSLGIIGGVVFLAFGLFWVIEIFKGPKVHHHPF